MSIRWRLALWYGTLFALVLIVAGIISYAIHTRGHYEDLDQVLVTSAVHAAEEAHRMGGSPHLVESEGGFGVLLRLYDAEGRLQEQTPGAGELLPTMPEQVLTAPAGPAFDRLVGWIPPLQPASSLPPGGAFGFLRTPEQRWRLYVLPLYQAQSHTGYIETVAPLGRLDQTIEHYRHLLLGLGMSSLLIVLVGGWALASRALAPIAQLTHTAQTIAHSRDLARRVESSPHRDELHELAETLNQMLASLEEASQRQQRFVADASHELRAPLTAIQGNLELVRRQARMTEEERVEALAEAEREASRLSRLVADLLVLARADAGVPLKQRRVELDALLLETFHQLRPLAREQRLTLKMLEPVQVLGDEERLKQLLLIVLNNALQYTPTDGKITLALHRQANQAELVIQDTGIGITAADLPHIFERFYRADPARSRDPGGTGLGLAIARWIIEQHEGQILIESEVGAGTIVTLRFPTLL